MQGRAFATIQDEDWAYFDAIAGNEYLIEAQVPAVEVYSIDECFADLTGIADASAMGCQLRSRNCL